MPPHDDDDDERTSPAPGARSAARAARRHPLAAKVPEITLAFWALKLLTTGVGEAMSDSMGQHSVPLAAAVGIFGIVLALWLQLRTPSTEPRSTGSA